MTVWETSNSLQPKRKLQKPAIFKLDKPPVAKLCSNYNIVVCSPNLDQTDPTVLVQILIFNFQKSHAIKITYSGQDLPEWAYLNIRGFLVKSVSPAKPVLQH